MKIVFGASSDKGKIKIRNEDHFSIIPPSFAGQPYIFAVSDGVGGRKGGQLASVKAIQKVGGFISRNSITKDNIKEIAYTAIEQANDYLISSGKTNKDLEGMGTTLVLCILVDDMINFFSIGDSRGYIVDDKDTLHQVTIDHTWTNELVRNGSLTEKKAMIHPHRHRLIRAIGVFDVVKPDYFSIALDRVKWVILCTDGLTEHVTNNQILNITQRGISPQEMADYMVKLSLRRGGTDNVTVVVARLNQAF